MSSIMGKEYLHYVNPDSGNGATICPHNDGTATVYTDLSAAERKYASLKEAKHDLFVRGYEPVDSP